MENTSKVLLISAAILVVIILITVGVKIFSTGSKTGEYSQTIGKKIADTGNEAIKSMNDNNNLNKIKSIYEKYKPNGLGPFKEALNSNGIIEDSISGNNSTGYTVVVDGTEFFLSANNDTVTVSIIKKPEKNYIILSASEFNKRVKKSVKEIDMYDQGKNLGKSDVLNVLSDIKSVCNDTNREIAIYIDIFKMAGNFTISNIDELIGKINNYKTYVWNFPDFEFPYCTFSYESNAEGYITKVKFISLEEPFEEP